MEEQIYVLKCNVRENVSGKLRHDHIKHMHIRVMLCAAHKVWKPVANENDGWRNEDELDAKSV